jgi:ABC-type antimicrobial peptide transport system permease subunit
MPGGRGAVLVNQEAVRRYFGGRNPIGLHVTSFGAPLPIVGVLGDVRLETLTDAPTPAIYLPHAVMTQFRSLSLIVRSRANALAILDAVRAEIDQVDRGIPVFAVRTMDEVLAEAVSRPRFSSTMLLLFSGLALALAAVGIYGVIAYAVNRRTREIGVRMALGARPRDALRLVLQQALSLVGIGVTIGLACAAALTRSLRSLLYEVSALDPTILASASLFLILVGLFAAWLPARRASRLDPVSASRRTETNAARAGPQHDGEIRERSAARRWLRG